MNEAVAIGTKARIISRTGGAAPRVRTEPLSDSGSVPVSLGEGK